MSIEFYLAATTAPADVVSYAFVTALTLAALGVAGALGVFRRRSVVGPVRLGKNDSWPAMLLVLGLTVTTWALTPPLYVYVTHLDVYESVGQATTLPATTPATSPARGAAIRPDALVKLSAVGSSSAFVICVLATIAYRPGGLTKLGFATDHLAKGAALGVLAALIVIPLVTAGGILTQTLWDALGLKHAPEHDLLRILGDPSEQSLRNLILFSAVVLAPLSEEMIFRGHLQTLLSRAFGAQQPRAKVFARWAAVLLTSAVFAAVHPWWMTPPIFLLAVCIGYLYERTGNLWACVVLHGLFNAANTTIFLLQAKQGV